MKWMGLLFVAAIVLGCSTRGPVAAPHVFAMSGNQLTISKGGPVIAPPPGDMAAFWDTDGTFKQIDPTGAVTAIGGGGFGQNTTINLPNSSSTPVPALNLVTALTSNTPGSEASSITTTLLNGGVAYPSVSLVPAGQTTDTISGAAAWTWNLNVGGVQKGQLSVGSTVSFSCSEPWLGATSGSGPSPTACSCKSVIAWEWRLVAESRSRPARAPVSRWQAPWRLPRPPQMG